MITNDTVMSLNNVKPANGSKHAKKRVGRGIGSGLGKTCGRGHKGQKSRCGGFHKVGFEGGQMPLQRRLPKRGFNSLNILEEVRLSDLNKIVDTDIDRLTLIKNGLASAKSDTIKIIKTGELSRVVHVRGLAVSACAKEIIVALGGSVS